MSTPHLAITSVVCRAGISGCSREEPVDSPRIILPRRGLFLYHLHHREFVADVNSAFLLDPGDVCRVSHPISGGDECTVLVPGSALLEECFGEGRWLEASSPFHRFRAKRIGSTPRVLLALRALQSSLGQTEEPLLAEETALGLLDEISKSSSVSHSSDRSAQRRDVERARAFLAWLPGEAHSLAAIGRAVHCSPFHLARHFRRATGSSIHQYLTALRMAAALDRLADGEEDLSRLAMDLGFASHSHLSATFRKVFGLSPSLARRTLARKSLLEWRRILTAHCPSSALPS